MGGHPGADRDWGSDRLREEGADSSGLPEVLVRMGKGAEAWSVTTWAQCSSAQGTAGVQVSAHVKERGGR